jgi:surface-anchored protein
VSAAAVVAACVVLVQPASAATGPVVLSSGHVDVFDVAYEDGALALHVHDETVEPGVEREPADVVFEVKKEARTSVPDDPSFAFLGKPGAPVWVLPQDEVEGLLFAGIATEEVPAGVFVDDSVRITVRRVYGPDDFSVFQVDSLGAASVLVDSGNGVPDSFTTPVGTHEHANWGFEKPGTYQLQVSASGVLASTGRRVTSDVEPYTFVVRSR